MTMSPQRFAQLLTEAIYKIRTHEAKQTRKTIGLIQDELGYTLGREGGSSIEYWRKGNIPALLKDVENLARELVSRGGLDREGLVDFLTSAGYPEPLRLRNRLFPTVSEALAPFVVGPPVGHPRQFFGREQLLRRIFGLWRHFPLQNVAVIGLHRSGKTSLLRYLPAICRTPPETLRPAQRHDWLPDPDHYRWAYVDFQDPRMASPARLLPHILTQLRLPVPDRCDLNDFFDVVSRHLAYPALILMDEIEAGLASPELDQQFWWSLRALGSTQTNGRLGFLLSGHAAPALAAQAQAKPSPFFNIFGHTLTLGPLTGSEALALVANSPLPFGLADVDWILEQSGRWPALLQILCDTRLTALQEGRPGPAWQAEGLRRLTPFRYLLEATPDL